MVQREVADRFFAAPRTKSYGAVSVLVQLAARKTGFHAVAPTVFRPRPRVESALVAFDRRPGASISIVRDVVEAAFAHRRKTAANSIALAGLASRVRVEEALVVHRPCGQRSRRGASTGRVRRARECAAMSRAPAFAKINLALVVGPLRPDGKHEVHTVLQRIDLHDEVALDRRQVSSSRDSPTTRSFARALECARVRGRGRAGLAACASTSGSRWPRASGAEAADAAAALRARQRNAR